MENFLFSINAALPVMITILLGIICKRFGVLAGEMTSALDYFGFKIALPLLMFTNIANMDLQTEFSLSFMLYCSIISLATFFILWWLSLKLFEDRAMAGSFAQASARGSVSILAVAIITSIYGSAGIAALMNACVVPIYNIMAVLILTHCGSGGELSASQQVKKALKGICTNPLIIGILAGLPFALLGIELPHFLAKPISDLSNCATPVCLLSMGAAFNMNDATARFKPALAASIIKLLIIPAVGLPIAIALGFRDATLTCIMLMLGSATAPASYIMSKQMGCDGPLSSNVVILTQMLYAVTLTLWLFTLRSLGLI